MLKPEIGSALLYRLTFLFLSITSTVFLLQVLGVLSSFTLVPFWDDPMYISGNLTILPGLWLSMTIESRTAKVAKLLDKDHLISLPIKEMSMVEYTRIKVGIWQVRGAWLVGLTVFCGFTYFFYRYYFVAAWLCKSYATDGFLDCLDYYLGADFYAFSLAIFPFVVVSVIFGFLTGARLGTLTGSSMLAHYLTTRGVTLELFPAHKDGVGGFGRFVRLVNLNGSLALVPVIWLGIWMNALVFSTSETLRGLLDWYWPFMGQILLALVFLTVCFFIPATKFNRAFKAKKDVIESDLDRKDANIKGRREYFSTIETVRALPDYPIGPAFGRVLTLAFAMPFFSLAFGVFFSTIGDDEQLLEYFRVIKKIISPLLSI